MANVYAVCPIHVTIFSTAVNATGFFYGVTHSYSSHPFLCAIDHTAWWYCIGLLVASCIAITPHTVIMYTYLITISDLHLQTGVLGGWLLFNNSMHEFILQADFDTTITLHKLVKSNLFTFFFSYTGSRHLCDCGPCWFCRLSWTLKE